MTSLFCLFLDLLFVSPIYTSISFTHFTLFHIIFSIISTLPIFNLLLHTHTHTRATTSMCMYMWTSTKINILINESTTGIQVFSNGWRARRPLPPPQSFTLALSSWRHPRPWSLPLRSLGPSRYIHLHISLHICIMQHIYIHIWFLPVYICMHFRSCMYTYSWQYMCVCVIIKVKGQRLMLSPT